MQPISQNSELRRAAPEQVAQLQAENEYMADVYCRLRVFGGIEKCTFTKVSTSTGLCTSRKNQLQSSAQPNCANAREGLQLED
jgi:hypothetical protein